MTVMFKMHHQAVEMVCLCLSVGVQVQEVVHIRYSSEMVVLLNVVIILLSLAGIIGRK